MEGFEIINKYNEKCLAWRCECAKLLAEWATAGDDKDKRYINESWVYCGILAAKGNTIGELLERVTAANIEHVITLLRLLRQRQAPSKSSCNFCTRLAEKGEHVEGCVGETPRTCNAEMDHPFRIGARMKCEKPWQHTGGHCFVSSHLL